MTDVDWRGPVLVTGTDTGVGKTSLPPGSPPRRARPGCGSPWSSPRVRTADPASCPTRRRGAAGRAGDRADPRRLPATRSPRSPRPGSPARPAGAVLGGGRGPGRGREHDLVLVEGAGGLLVPMGVRPSGRRGRWPTSRSSLGAPAVVVARAGLGTLNHTALTLEALERRGVPAPW